MTYLSLPTFDLRAAKLIKEKCPQPTKTAGIIAGLAPQSTSLFYESMTKYCLQNYAHAYPRLLINSVNCWEVVEILAKKDLDGLLAFLSREIALFTDNVDFLVMVCNSIHAVLDQLRQQFKIPIMAIHEEVSKEVALSNIKRVGILGTSTTINSHLYQNELASYGIRFRTLAPEQIAYFDQRLFQETLHGNHLGAMRKMLLEGINSLADMSCEAVILGCTELPLFVDQEDTDIPLFPSTHILSKAMVDACFGAW